MSQKLTGHVGSHAREDRSVRRLGPALLVEGVAVLELRALVEMGVKLAGRDGIRPSRNTEHLRRVIAETADAVVSGHADVRVDVIRASSNHQHDSEIKTSEVARMTGLSERQARRLTSDLGGRKTRSGPWLIQRALIEAHLIERQGRNT
jgi:hypothetical protein